MISEQDYRWVKKDGTRCTWLESLKAACAQYGRSSGRWHDNDYWRDLGQRAETMSEAEAEQAVRTFEREADEALAHWRSFQ